MALTPIINSFNAGELSPYMEGRSDLAKYYSGCRLLENMYALPYGPAARMPGTYFVAELKDSSKKARLVSFQHSTEQAYILEFGDQYIRFCKDRGQIITGIGTEDLSAIGNIVGHWLLNDNAASKVVLDDDGETYNGDTITNNTSVLHAIGKVGSGCFDLQGVDAVEINDNAALSFDDSGDNPFTIAAWVSVTPIGGRQVIFSKWKSGSLREYRLSLDPDLKLQLDLCDDSKALDASIVAHWKLNENAANTEVHDDTAAGAYPDPHDGVSTANTSVLHISGKVGSGCFDLDGQYAVEVADSDELSFVETTKPFSLAVWLYVTHTGSAQYALSKYDMGVAEEWALLLASNNKLTFLVEDESAAKTALINTTDVVSEGWHFVVCTYDSTGGANAHTGMNMYIDGELATTSGSTETGYVAMENLDTKVVIGARYSGGVLDGYWADKIDNAAIFSKELSTTDVAVLWNDGIGTEDIEGTYPYRLSDDALTEGWHFVAATYDSTGGATAANGIVLYVDGVAVDSTAHNEATYVAMEDTATKVRIGASYSGAAAIEYIWADKIDDVALFSEHLTATQVASLYSVGAYEISSSYLEADLFGLQQAQSADVLFNVHSNYPPSKLMRYAHDSWELADITFDWPPFLEENDTDITITPSATTGSITLTASSAIFTSDHIDSYWLIKHPRTDDEGATANAHSETISASDTSGTILVGVKGSWRLRTRGSYVGGFALQRSYDSGSTWHTLQTFNPDAATVYYDVTGEEEEECYLKVITRTCASGDLKYVLSVERYYHYGIINVTAFTDSTHVTATVTRTLGSTDATKLWSEGAWSAERGYPGAVAIFEERTVWSGSTYKPYNLWFSKSHDWENMMTGTLDDDALIYDLPTTESIRWLISHETLLIGTEGDEWRLGSPDPNTPLTPSEPSAPRRQTTYGSNTIQARLVNNMAVFVQRQGRKVRGCKYYFEKGEQGGYDAEDLTMLAEHITESGIVDMAYQNQPDSVLWCVRADGVLVGLTLEPNENVMGGYRIVTDGEFESVAVVRGTTEDEVWVIVKRTINGATKRYIEYFKPRDWGSDQKDCFFVHSGLTFDGGAAVDITDITVGASPYKVTVTATAHGRSNGDQVRIKDVVGMTDVNNKVYTVSDKATDTFILKDEANSLYITGENFGTYTSGGTIQKVDKTFSGLGHLEGETIAVLADGAVHDDVVVTGGHITLTVFANKVHAGLPYTPKLMPMKPEIPTRKGSVRGDIKRIHQIIFSFHNTVGATFGTTTQQDQIPFRKVSDVMGEAVPLFTGLKSMSFRGGYELDGDVYVEQTQPLPLTVRSIVMKMAVYDE